jgi:hypothetical protein
MSEGFKTHKHAPKPPQTAESGSLVDAFETRQKFERQTIAHIFSSLSNFARTEGYTCEIEEVEGGGDVNVSPETLALTLGHLKPLLREANDLLLQHQMPFRMRVAVRGALLELRAEPQK